MWVSGHSRSLELIPFESLCTVSYSHSIHAWCMAVSCIISEIKREISRNHDFSRVIWRWILFVFYSNMAVSVAVCEIFNVKEWCDLENRVGFVQGHWKWHHLIDRIRVPIHLPYSNYGAILYHLRDIASYYSKITKFLYPTCTGWLHRNFVTMFDAGKTIMIGLPYGEKLWQYVKPFSYNTGR